MILSYTKFVTEAIGAESIERRTVDKLNRPYNPGRPNKPIDTGRRGTPPGQWAKSPSAMKNFGANPRIKNNDNKMPNHIDNWKKFSNKEKKVEEQENAAADVMSVPEEFKADQETINREKNELAQLKQTVLTKEIQVNKMISELQNKIAAARANAAKAQSGSVQTQIDQSQPPQPTV